MMVRAMLCVLAVSLVGIAYSEEAAPHNGGVTGTTTLPSTDVCGKRGGRIKRVVGGSDADPGIFPWMAALGYIYSRFSNIHWVCAGSLVTERHVVTAAECDKSAYGLYRAVVRMGIRDLNDTIEENGGTPTDYEVDSWIQYPGYNVAEKVNDIAIIRLKNKVTFSHLIQPICLPTLGDFRTKNFTGFEAYIAGWGVSYTVTDGARPTRLQQAQILIWGQTECKTAYDTVMKGIIDPRMVCAADDGKDTCQGDYGGPLMIPYGPDSNYYLYGVASFRVGRCGDPNYPGVYTRVSGFTDWILQNLK